MPALTIYTNPLTPGLCQVPVFSVGDSTSWTMTFNNGTANYDPGSVSVVLGNIGGLENINYKNAFRFVDRLNNQSVASDFTITSGVPGVITWDSNPQYIEGANGAYMIRGYRGAGTLLRSIVIINGQSVGGTGGRLSFNGAAPVTGGPTFTTTDESQKVLSIQVANGGSAFTSQPTVVITSASGTGAAATAIINGQGIITAVVVTAKGSGYLTDPTISFTGGGGSGATATATRGVANTITSISTFAVATAIATYSSPPAIAVETANGTNSYTTTPLLEPAGVLANDVCFIRDPVTQEVLTGAQCIPIWNGRISTGGSPVYDDALLVIRPRIILTPTFTASGSGANTVYSGTMDPVTTWVKAVLRYRRSCTVDIEVFGAGRLLFLGKLTVMNDAT